MSRNKKVLITGVTGQDGAHLANYLLKKGYDVYGGFRRGSSNKTWRMDYLGITDKINLVEFQLSELQNIIEILRSVKPDEVYNLAGESFVADSFKYPGVTFEANTHGVINILEAARLVIPECRLFFASSSEVFGHNESPSGLNESSECTPVNPYAISKLACQHIVRMYREHYKMFACSGILFNHEGPLRARQFVTRKITFNIARLKINQGMPMELGDLDSARDWGSAEDYVAAMHRMLSIDNPTDMVIATGRLTKVREFLSISAKAAGFDPEFIGKGVEEKCVDKSTGLELAIVSRKYFRIQDTPPMVGNPRLIEKMTGWVEKKSLEDLVIDMVDADIMRWENGITNV